MAKWICEQCASPFTRDKSGMRPIRFCSLGCYHQWRAENHVTTGQFKGGEAPWNKGVKGLHLSPETEFKKGQPGINWMPVGSESERLDKNGTMRAFVKVSEPNVWVERAVVVWERHHGNPVPKGLVIHHKDHDALNDIPENLEALTRSEHINVHREELQMAKLIRAQAFI